MVLVALGVVGFAYWSDYRADQQRPGSTAVQIDDTKYPLRYFTERLRMFVQQSGGPANQAAQPSVAIPAVTDQIVQEEIVLRFAAEMGVSASESDIRDEIATRLGLAADDPDFDTRFQEELPRSGLREEEYRLMIEAAVLTDKVRARLETDVPASAESIRTRLVLVSDQATADEIKRLLDGGSDFEQLAADLSLELESQWTPRGVLDSALEETLFGLEPGEVAIIPTPFGVQVIEVLEKAADREIDAEQRPILAETALQEWLNEKRGELEVKEFVSQDQDKARWAIERAYGLT